MSSPDIVCFYHADCLDGWAAALAVYAKFAHDRPVRLVPVKYHDAPTDFEGCDVFIVDFCFDDCYTTRLLTEAASLHLFDHHKGSIGTYSDFRFIADPNVHVIHDETRSGALITWQALFPNQVPTWVDSVSDRDLWQFRYEFTLYVCEGLMANPMELSPFWLSLISEDAQTNSGTYLTLMAEITTTGAAILKYRDNLIQSTIAYTASETIIQGHVIPIINTIRPLGSETVGELAKHFPYAIGWYVERNQYKLSFRADGDSPIDLNALLKPHGGGGHAKASGLVLPIQGRDIYTAIHQTFHPTLLQKLIKTISGVFK